MNTKSLKPIATMIVSIALVVAALTVITSQSVQSGGFTLWAAQAHVITVDDCEYIVYTDAKNHSSMVHKQNCTNCEKRSKLK